MRKKSFLLVGLGIVVLFCLFGMGLAEASNASLIDGGVGLSSIDDTLKKLARGIVALARPIVAVMTAIAGAMAILNVGDSKRPMWYAILGIGLILNLGDVLLAMWGKYANPTAGLESAIEYSIQIKNTANADGNGVDILSTFMKYYLEIIVTGAERIKPIAVKLLLVLALIDSSIRLALDLTEKDKLAWAVKTFLRIGFYVFLINSWLGVGGLNLMDSLSRGFQEIGFVAGNYGQALPTSIEKRADIDPKDNLAPDSIVNNTFKIFNTVFAIVLNPGSLEASSSGSVSDTINQQRQSSNTSNENNEEEDPNKSDTDYEQTVQNNGPSLGTALGTETTIGKIYNGLETFLSSPFSSILLAVSLLIFVVCCFLVGLEMFMARIEFYTLALLGIPLLAFGAIKHFEYLAHNTIRAVFNCGVKLSIIAFLQAVLCRIFSKYTADVVHSMSIHRNDLGPEIQSLAFQLVLMSLIMFLLVFKVPKLIQGLLSGNPSLGASDMTGTAMGVATTAATTAAVYVGAGKAALEAKAAKAEGKDVAPWKMSQMKQFGAALMRRAPVIGPAYGAYNEVANFGKNDNQGDRDNSRNNSPVTNPEKPNPQHKPMDAPAQTPQGPGGGGTPQKAGGGYVEPSHELVNTENTNVQGYEGAVTSRDASADVPYNSGNDNTEGTHGADASSDTSELRMETTPPPAEPLNNVQGYSSDTSELRMETTPPPAEPLNAVNNPSEPPMQYRSMATAPYSGSSITNPQAKLSAPPMQYQSERRMNTAPPPVESRNMVNHISNLNSPSSRKPRDK